ncbi:MULTISPECIES: hypothetical protein [unclassified Brevundimonas]|uniref:hypothetical protein n=1 Tax=unclassified Brevundimonas TaxID=2622653 RepID=UPI0006FB05C2|nr:MULTISPECIES: hypothetical protein [unclassified Brevundimonas]KQY90818.1 hypothetical protein ASD25_20070 [Brevundimonas sp. Root1423]KRA28475.1 hypothetical protein ASD59_01195 [Brevundimonas sp. Root608]
MRPALALTAAALLAACATPAAPPPQGPPEVVIGEDCAVIAAVAKDHYRFNTTDNRPPPLRFEGDYAPRCDWSRYGLAFEAWDPNATGDPRRRVRWVSFARPVYDGRGALVATGIMHGPLAGMGYECRVHSGFNGWTVGECRRTWVS